MHDSDPQYDANLEAELRAVPLPDGLLARLRQTALSDDAGLDEAVREVAMPARLAVRLRAMVAVDDAGLDAAVRDVPVPAGLLASIRRAVLIDDDDALDEALRDVRVPSTARRRAARPRSLALQRFARMAVAVSLFLAVGIGYFASVAALVIATRSADRDPSSGSLIVLSGGPERDDRTPMEALAEVSPAPELPMSEPPMPSKDDLRIELFASNAPAGLAEVNELFVAWHGGEGPDPMMVPPPNVYGISAEIDSLPELKKVAPPAPQGMQPPLAPQFPLRELDETGFFPWLMPAAHYRLRTWHVPLTQDTASYELARRYLEDGELPPPDKVRTEEFLAALDYQFPAPKSRPLELTATAGPSPFAGEGFWLLQVGAQARPPIVGNRPPAHVIVAMDASASMQWGGRIDMARRALAGFFRQLTPDDRVSLVSFTSEPTVWFEDAGVEEAEAMVRTLDGIRVAGATNVIAGVNAAYDVAARNAGSRPTRIILLTDGGATIDGRTERRLEAARSSVRLTVVDLGQAVETDGQLRRFAAAGGGVSLRATNRPQISGALLETLTGRAQRVADDVRLLVTFNPKAVVGYRFFGHEPSALGRLSADLPPADLSAGQAVSGLFEMRLLGGDQEVASVELSWNPPEGGARQRIVKKIFGRDIAPNVGQMAPSLQAAALAARAAEVLRVPRPPRSRPMSAVLAVAKDFDGSLLYQPSYLELLDLCEQADRARPSRVRR